MFIGIAIAVWVASGILSYGIWVSFYKRELSYFAIGKFQTVSHFLLGTVSLLATLLATRYPYGFDLHPYTREERWENFNQLYNQYFTYMTREEFDKEY